MLINFRGERCVYIKEILNYTLIRNSSTEVQSLYRKVLGSIPRSHIRQFFFCLTISITFVFSRILGCRSSRRIMVKGNVFLSNIQMEFMDQLLT
jgi:hypothetical protein